MRRTEEITFTVCVWVLPRILSSKQGVEAKNILPRPIPCIADCGIMGKWETKKGQRINFIRVNWVLGRKRAKWIASTWQTARSHLNEGKQLTDATEKQGEEGELGRMDCLGSRGSSGHLDLFTFPVPRQMRNNRTAFLKQDKEDFGVWLTVDELERKWRD